MTTRLMFLIACLPAMLALAALAFWWSHLVLLDYQDRWNEAAASTEIGSLESMALSEQAAFLFLNCIGPVALPIAAALWFIAIFRAVRGPRATSSGPPR
jgi:hypothetical protein